MHSVIRGGERFPHSGSRCAGVRFGTGVRRERAFPSPAAGRTFRETVSERGDRGPDCGATAAQNGVSPLFGTGLPVLGEAAGPGRPSPAPHGCPLRSVSRDAPASPVVTAASGRGGEGVSVRLDLRSDTRPEFLFRTTGRARKSGGAGPERPGLPSGRAARASTPPDLSDSSSAPSAPGRRRPPHRPRDMKTEREISENPSLPRQKPCSGAGPVSGRTSGRPFLRSGSTAREPVRSTPAPHLPALSPCSPLRPRPAVSASRAAPRKRRPRQGPPAGAGTGPRRPTCAGPTTRPRTSPRARGRPGGGGDPGGGARCTRGTVRCRP